MLGLVHSTPFPIDHEAAVNRSFSLPDTHELGTPFAPVNYSRGATLCLEGHPAAGAFCICTGRAKEYFISQHGKTAILRISMPGDLVGLEPMLAGTAYATTVEALEPTTAYFITRRDFQGLMRQDETFRIKVTEQLTKRCKSAYGRVRQAGFAASIAARLAHFLLGWSRDKGAPDQTSIQTGLTHEEISQLIGSTRETVSRILTRFRRLGWIRTKGTQLQIVNEDSLSALAREQRATGIWRLQGL
jgi:CRP/FNR family transcriptional regulator, cyclic AMP receptor protein